MKPIEIDPTDFSFKLLSLSNYADDIVKVLDEEVHIELRSGMEDIMEIIEDLKSHIPEELMQRTEEGFNCQLDKALDKL